MRWANFLSQYHFHIAHIAGNKNKVMDALSKRPRVNAVSIACNHDLTSMIESYAQDSDYQEIVVKLAEGTHKIPIPLRKDFSSWKSVMCYPRYACKGDE